MRVRLASRKGNGERRGTVGSGGKSEIGKRLYVPYIWIRKCILFSDGCGALEKKQKKRRVQSVIAISTPAPVRARQGAIDYIPRHPIVPLERSGHPFPAYNPDERMG